MKLMLASNLRSSHPIWDCNHVSHTWLESLLKSPRVIFLTSAYE